MKGLNVPAILAAAPSPAKKVRSIAGRGLHGGTSSGEGCTQGSGRGLSSSWAISLAVLLDVGVCEGDLGYRWRGTMVVPAPEPASVEERPEPVGSVEVVLGFEVLKVESEGEDVGVR